jgi:hypothetical protein
MVVRAGCRAHLNAEDTAMIAETLRHNKLREVILHAALSLDELLRTPYNFEVYLYERIFDEARG